MEGGGTRARWASFIFSGLGRRFCTVVDGKLRYLSTKDVSFYMDWKALERGLFEAGEQALRNILDQEGARSVYAAAFHASYREEQAVISLPSFGVNTLRLLDEWECEDASFSGMKWNPVDWQWDLELEQGDSEVLTALDAELQAYANRGTYRHWQGAERRFLVTVARAAKALSVHFAGHPNVTEHFVVIFHDFGGDIALAKRSLTRHQFEANFPVELAIERTLGELAGLPLDEQAAFYMTRLRQYQGISSEDAERWLIAHGQVAQSGLIQLLDDHEGASTAARILGLAGVADTAVIEALRRTAQTGSTEPARHWSGSALGYLGDEAWLFQQPGEVPVKGLCANFESFRLRGAVPRVLDYAPLERLLAARPELESAVEQALEDAGWWGHPTDLDLAEADRGRASRYAGINRHAVSIIEG